MASDQELAGLSGPCGFCRQIMDAKHVGTRDHLRLQGVTFEPAGGSFRRISSKRYACSLCPTVWIVTFEPDDVRGQFRREVWDRG